MSDIRVRFAPSPTGYLHIGGARTALYNWLFARQTGGTFVLRMEDTDQERNTEAARQTIFDGLDWLGFVPDEGPQQGGDFGPYSQSERQDIYLEWGRKLIDAGAVYPCFCTRSRLAELRAEQEANKENFRYDGLCRSLSEADAKARIAADEDYTWRLKVPEGEAVEIEDLVRGKVRVETKDIEDIILVRSNGMPVYNFVVVIDDHLMQISHVVRGEDHLTNTFKQVLIYQALGLDTPIFAHLPLILGPTGQGKLSKRKHPEAALECYQQKGYPVAGLVNWLALVGWSFDGETEFMTRDELVDRFSFERVNAAGARLPLDKLDAISGDHIREMSDADVAREITPYLESAGLIGATPDDDEKARVAAIAAATRERLRHFSQIEEMVAWAKPGDIDLEPKAAKNLNKEGARDVLAAYRPVLSAGDFTSTESLETGAREFCEAQGVGFGKLVHPVRAALTGRTQGPGLFDCAAIVGQEECDRRIAKALEHG